MCGICAILEFISTSRRSGHRGCPGGLGIDSTALIRSVQRRGPDSCRSQQVESTNSAGCGFRGDFTATVLRMQGSRNASHQDDDPDRCRWRQPLGFPSSAESSAASVKRSRSPSHEEEPEDAQQKRSFLLWNGEVFAGNCCAEGDKSDTLAVFEALSTIEREIISQYRRDRQQNACQAFGHYKMRFLERVRDLLEGIHGPFALVFVAAGMETVCRECTSDEQQRGGMVVIARDPLGRRSLCVHYHSAKTTTTTPTNQLPTSTTTAEERWKEQLCISSVCGYHDEQNDGSSDGKTCTPKVYHNGSSDAHSESTLSASDGNAKANTHNSNIVAATAAGTCWFQLPIDGLYVVQRQGMTSCHASKDDDSVCNPHRQHVSDLTNGLLNRVLPWAYRHVQHPLNKEHRLSLATSFSSSLTSLSSCSKSKFQRFFEELQRCLFDCAVAAGPNRDDLAFFLDSVQTVHYGFDEKARRKDCLTSQLSAPFYTDTNEAADEWFEADSVPEAAARYLAALVRAVWRRAAVHTNGFTEANGSRSLMVPLSGGIDSTVLAVLAHYVLPPPSNNSSPGLSAPPIIEMPNIAFGADPSQAPDRQAAAVAAGEILALPGARERCAHSTHDAQHAVQPGLRLVLVNGGDATGYADSSTTGDTTISSRVEQLISPSRTVMDHNIGTAVWWAVRGEGVVVTPSDLPAWVEANSANCGTSRLVRTGQAASSSTTSNGEDPSNPFTGEHGVFQPLIDALIAEGVGDGFVQVSPTDGGDNDTADDGRTAEEFRPAVRPSTLGKEYSALLRPAMDYGVEIDNKFLAKEKKHRKPFKRIIDYCHGAQAMGLVKVINGQHFPTLPNGEGGNVKSTKMKVVTLAKACDIERAQHFSSGRRVASGTNPTALASPPQLYRCVSRTVLLGMGADETLGGYTRHRRTYERGGVPSLRAELDTDFERLWSRNLGRDDRIGADHSREARFPFLDEEVLATLSSIAADDAFRSPDGLDTEGMLQVCNPALPAGVGDKRVLRTVARCLGLRDISRLVKRAVQFGTRIANPRADGSANIETVATDQLTKLNTHNTGKDE